MRISKNNPRLNIIALLILGTVTWSATMVKNGLLYDYGLGFWGPHGHDAIWHLSLINSLSLGSLQIPIFAGSTIQNYHLGFDIFLAFLHVVTRIPASFLYFQILPPIFAFLIGWLTYRLTLKINNSTTAAWWSTFCVYFAGSLGWILDKGESPFWSQQAISTLINPPYALSLILTLLLLLLIDRRRYFLAIPILILLPHIKIYAGLLVFGGLLVAAFKERNILKTFIPGLLIYFLTSFQLITTSTQLITWSPGWFLLNLFAPDRLDWPRVYSALNTYSSSFNWVKGPPLLALVFGVFLVGNLGIRILGASHLTSIKKWSWLSWFMVSIIAAGILVPTLFIQSGTAWNTIQFFYYSQFFLSILSGITLATIFMKLKSKLFVAGICLFIFLITARSSWDTLRNYLPDRPPAMVSTNELEMLKVLAKQPAGVVLTAPATVNPYAPAPRPLYMYESTAYVSALSGQQTFLEDTVNLSITRYPWEDRLTQVKQFFTTNDLSWASQFIKQNNIRYLYLPNSQFNPVLDPASLGFVRINLNSSVILWSINN